MTDVQAYALSQDATFRGRVASAIAKKAVYVASFGQAANGFIGADAALVNMGSSIDRVIWHVIKDGTAQGQYDGGGSTQDAITQQQIEYVCDVICSKLW
jgi:hypothetical protein